MSHGKGVREVAKKCCPLFFFVKEFLLNFGNTELWQNRTLATQQTQINKHSK